MKLGLIGLGHIGGSYALSLRKAGFVNYVVGTDHSEAHEQQALALGIADETRPWQEIVTTTDLVLLAIPVKAAVDLLPEILDILPEKTVVFDVGSTKATICEGVIDHPRRDRYVSTHPIAGRENSGPAAAMTSLLAGKKAIICEPERSAPDALKLIEALYDSLQMDLLYMEGREHDTHLAYISHLSHLTSFTLALSVLRAEKEEEQIFRFAGSGFDSTARLAKSSPEMWASIFLDNKTPLLDVLNRYMSILEEFRDQIARQDQQQLTENMYEANEIRRILEGFYHHTD